MAAKRAPTRTPAPPRAKPRPEGLSAKKVSEWVGLIISVLSIVTVGVDGLYSHWKKGEEAQQTASALTLLKTQTSADLATAKSDLSDRLTKVETHADTIDKTGTDYGRSQYSTQSVERAQIKKDVADLQDTIRELAPVLNEVKVNVRWLMANAGAPDAVTTAQTPHPRPRDLRRRTPR